MKNRFIAARGRAIIILAGIASLAFALLLANASPMVARAVPHIQPILLQMAAERPDATIGVIVQKSVKGNSVEETVAQMGGTVTTDLSIINAFAAELPAKEVRQLAQANGVRWVSLDAPMEQTGTLIDTTNLKSAGVKAIRADLLWNEAPANFRGQGVTIAIVDSGGCSDCGDLRENGKSRYLTEVSFSSQSDPRDFYGHGSLVAGIAGANGNGSNKQYIGVAPDVNFVNVKVSDNLGKATASNVIAGLQWVKNNAQAYNIRVVNFSLNASVWQSYNNDPLAAAAEILWFNKIVVVVAAGNNGSAKLFPPANDPFVITVGATNDQGTPSIGDDVIASFSAYGATETGEAKPDLVAPGTKIVSVVPRYKNKIWKDHSDHRIPMSDNTEYFMFVSGTSMAAPMVSGAAAILLQSNPNLTPDQVKYRLKATANKSWAGYNAAKAGAGYLDIYAAVHGATTQSANTGITASHLLWTGIIPITWDSVNWDSVNWESVNWDSVNWESVNWDSMNWDSDYWGP